MMIGSSSKRKRRRNSRKAKFSGRKVSKRGIISCITGFLSLVCLGVFVFIAYKLKGEAGVYYGSFGVLAFFFAVFSMILGILGLKEEDVYKLFPIIGTVLGILSTGIWIVIYLLGLGVI